jgi:hypothetical protein
MHRDRIDRVAIRDWVRRPSPAEDAAFVDLVQRLRDGRISRRGFLEVASATLPTSHAIDGWLGDEGFSLAGDERRVAFLVNGVERWVIEPARFGGNARLRIRRGRDTIDVELIGARLPGTRIRADFACSLSRERRRTVRLQLPWGGFAGFARLVPWLEGRVPMRAPWAGRHAGVLFGDLHLDIAGNGLAEFQPDWTLRVVGTMVASLRDRDGVLPISGFKIGLVADELPRILKSDLIRRSHIDLAWNARKWRERDVVTSVLASHGVVADQFPFDSAVVECGEDRSGNARSAIVFQQGVADALRFQPSGTLRGEDGSAFSMALADGRLAIAANRGRSEHQFIANYASEATGLADGVRLRFGANAHTPPFELRATSRGLEQLVFEPAVLHVSAPLADALTDACTVAPQSDALCTRDAVEKRSFQWIRTLITLFSPMRGRPRCIRETPDGLPGFPMSGREIKVCRPEDLLVLTFRFEDLFLKARFRKPPVLRTRPGATGRLTVLFPSQNIAEEAYPDPEAVAPTFPAKAILAGETRLVFDIPAGTEIEYSLRGLLDWSQLRPSLVPYARRPGEEGPHTNTIAAPLATETAIESAYRITFSPHADSGWAHAREAVCDGQGRAELWHTRLAVRAKDSIDEENAAGRTVRAIWSPDYDPPPAGGGDAVLPDDRSPFNMSLKTRHRHQIVRSTSDFSIDSDRARRSAPISAKRLMLTALGAWMDVRGAWDPPNGRNLVLEEYIHKTTAARDQFVRAVEKGYLFPTGHRASFITETERKLDRINGRFVARLRQRIYIKIRQRERNYPALGQPFAARDCLFTRIVFGERDLTTPNLDAVVRIDPNCPTTFWPRVNGQPFRFRFSGIDVTGRASELEAPLIFIGADEVFPSGVTAALAPCVHVAFADYQNELALRTVDGRGQIMACAPADAAGQTEFPTNILILGAQQPEPQIPGAAFRDSDQAPFFPRIEKLTSRIPALTEMTGNDRAVQWQLAPVYIEHGFEPATNRGEVYGELLENLELVLGSTPTGASQPQNTGDRAGGLATPSAKIVGLSRRLGLVGGATTPQSPGAAPAALAGPAVPATTGAASNVTAGRFEPKDFFGGFTDTKLLGVVRLQDVIAGIGGGLADNLGEAPKLLRNAIYGATAALKTAAAAVAAQLASLPPDLRNRFGEHARELDRLARAHVSDPGEAARQAAAIVQVSVRLAEEIDKIIANPSFLLPAGLQAFRDLVLDPQNGLSRRVASLIGAESTINAIKTAIDAYQTELTQTIAPLRAHLAADVLQAIDELTTLRNQVDRAVADAITELKQASNADAVQRVVDIISRLARDTNTAQTLATMILDASGLNIPNVAVARQQVESALVAFIAPAAVPTQQTLAELEQIGTVLRQQAIPPAESAVRDALDGVRRLKQLGAATEATARRERLRAERQLVEALLKLEERASDALTFGSPPQPLRPALAALVRQHTQLRHIVAAAPGVVKQRTDAIVSVLTGQLRAEVERRVAAVLEQMPATPTPRQLLEFTLRILDAIDRVNERAEWLLQLAGRIQGQALQRLAQARQEIDARRIAYRKEFQQGAINLRGLLTKAIGSIPPELKPIVGPALDVLVNEVTAYADGSKGPEDLASLSTALEVARTRLLETISDPLKHVIDLGVLRKAVEDFLAKHGVPEAIDLSYTWKPTLKSIPSGSPLFEASRDGRPAELDIVATSAVSLRGAAPQFNVQAILKNFTLHLLPSFPMVHLYFDAVEFTTNRDGTRVQVKLADAKFGEALTFVRELAEYLNPSTGPFLDIRPTGIIAGFRVGLPSLTLGGLNVYNLSFFTSISLSFIGQPLALTFGVGDRRNPFIITVGILGGGGYFALSLTAAGLRSLEGAIEVGAMARIDLGVARGEGYIFAGFFFRIEKVNEQNRTKLCGYVRAGGELTIIGIISMSLELYCGVCWESPNRVTGEASLVVEIHLFLFEVSVEVRVRYTFSGSDPESDSQPQPTLLLPPAPRTESMRARHEPARVPAGAVRATSASVKTNSYDWASYRGAFDE